MLEVTVNLSVTFNNQMSAEGSLALGGGSLNFFAAAAVEDNRWSVESWPKALKDVYWRDQKVRQQGRPAAGSPRVIDRDCFRRSAKLASG